MVTPASRRVSANLIETGEFGADRAFEMNQLNKVSSYP